MRYPPIQTYDDPWSGSPTRLDPVEDASHRRRADGPIRRLVAPLAAAVLGAVVATSVTLGVVDRTETDVPAPVAPSVVTDGELGGVAAVAAAVLPSVVRIDVTAGRSNGTGSGVIYTSEGHIITNAHVVEGASAVRVTLSTGEVLDATVVGDALPSDDIAVLKVDDTGLPAARLGSSADLNVGDAAVAVGSPFGLEGTVTAGVISALHRNIDFGGGERFTDAIQTDAPINPGNSGGALATADGSVIGINTAIVGGSAGNVGVGFAIPIDIAARDADQIIQTGHASRPFLGIAGETIPSDGGALVQSVEPGGPAATAGIEPGDVIVELDGSAIGSMEDLIAQLSRRDVAQTISVVVVRDDARRTFEVTTVARPE